MARGCAVGFYRDHVFPRVMNLACNTKETRRIRAADESLVTSIISA